MDFLSKILLPVDFSERSVGAAHYANLLAARFHSEIILLHVIPPPQIEFAPGDAGGTMLAQLYENHSSQVAGDLEGFAAQHLAGLPVRRAVEDGDPAATIVEQARKENCGLIIMPTHGYGPFRRFILGSNTAKVLHDADCAVWTGVHLEEATAAGSLLKRVLCAVDLGAQSSRALCWAAQLAQSWGADLGLVHAVAALPEEMWQAGVRQAAEEELRRLAQALCPDAEILIEAGDAAKVICAAAERTEADVLVIGRGSAAGVYGRLRANAYAIIRMSPCPVVSV
jgi:nucleotide-binding universal stress UspA family protein